MALILIQTKGTKTETGYVGTTRPIFSKTIATKVANITGIKLPVAIRTSLTILVLCICMICSAQTKVVLDSKGNYVSVSSKKDTTKSGGKSTGKTFTARDGQSYPVLESVNGKLYYMKTSRNGNMYKVYLKV